MGACVGKGSVRLDEAIKLYFLPTLTGLPVTATTERQTNGGHKMSLSCGAPLGQIISLICTTEGSDKRHRALHLKKHA